MSYLCWFCKPESAINTKLQAVCVSGEHTKRTLHNSIEDAAISIIMMEPFTNLALCVKPLSYYLAESCFCRAASKASLMASVAEISV